jgi:hypothetical protein
MEIEKVDLRDYFGRQAELEKKLNKYIFYTDYVKIFPAPILIKSVEFMPNTNADPSAIPYNFESAYSELKIRFFARLKESSVACTSTPIELPKRSQPFNISCDSPSSCTYHAASACAPALMPATIAPRSIASRKSGARSHFSKCSKRSLVVPPPR